MIIAPADFNGTECSTARNTPVRLGAEVYVASATTQTAAGMQGTQVVPDLSLEDVAVDEHDGVVPVDRSGVEDAYFHVNLALDGGRRIYGVPSAVVNLAVKPFRVLRGGPIKRDETERAMELSR